MSIDLDTGNHEMIFVPKYVQTNIRRLEKHLDSMTEEPIFVDMPKVTMWTCYITAMYKVNTNHENGMFLYP